jgi:hypothetical protein
VRSWRGVTLKEALEIYNNVRCAPSALTACAGVPAHLAHVWVLLSRRALPQPTPLCVRARAAVNAFTPTVRHFWGESPPDALDSGADGLTSPGETRAAGAPVNWHALAAERRWDLGLRSHTDRSALSPSPDHRCAGGCTPDAVRGAFSAEPPPVCNVAQQGPAAGAGCSRSCAGSRLSQSEASLFSSPSAAALQGRDLRGRAAAAHRAVVHHNTRAPHVRSRQAAAWSCACIPSVSGEGGEVHRAGARRQGDFVKGA